MITSGAVCPFRDRGRGLVSQIAHGFSKNDNIRQLQGTRLTLVRGMFYLDI
jgi:hypothetical protein